MKYFIAIFIFCSTIAKAQTTVVRGTVSDNRNRPIPFVSVAFTGSTVGVITDDNGRYVLRSNNVSYTQVKISFVGYKTYIHTIIPDKDQTINVKLEVEGKLLNEVTVKGAKAKRYKNKDNPAVELIRKVIANKNNNRPESYNYTEYEKYEKLQFSLSNLSTTFSDRKFFRKYKFLLDNRDTTTLPGKSLLPIYLDEKISQNYYRKNPETKKTIVKGEKKVNFGSYMDEDGINTYLNRMYSEVDIYANNIFLMTNQFLSPIADAAPTFYKFFITDTITENGNKFIELSFTPRNTTDMLFEGEIYITTDGNYAVKKAKLAINKNINLNWVRDMYINQEFEQNPDGKYHLDKNDMMADFGITKKGKTGLFGQRSFSYRNYKLNIPHPDTTYGGPTIETVDDAENHSEQYWVASRGKDTLTTAESSVYHNIDSLKRMPSFRRTMDIVTLLVAGYKSVGPFEIGPSNAFYSFNPVEGVRLRFGGRTTTQLSTRYYFETYGAYGLTDQKWKYFLSGTYSLNNKSIYKFPQNYLRASVQRDTKIPGAELQFVTEDNFLLSFKRGINDKYLYNDYYKLDYVHEYKNHFSYSVGLKSWKQSPAGSLYFNHTFNGLPHIITDLTTTEVSVGLRYAPHEQFFQGKLYRVDIPSKYPIFSLNYTQAIKDVFGGQYSYKSVHARIDKRFYLSQLGYTDVIAEGEYIFGQIPFPLLTIQRANQTYAYQPDSYNLMNFLEFVSDHNASISINHCFNGFIFNKVPLLKKLKWREYVTFKALYGGVRTENHPELNPLLFQLPVNSDGTPITYLLGKTPYTEGSVGIGNILKFFRVDLVERFNYLDHAYAPRFGIRTRAIFDF